jgi:hypothetical protein
MSSAPHAFRPQAEAPSLGDEMESARAPAIGSAASPSPAVSPGGVIESSALPPRNAADPSPLPPERAQRLSDAPSAVRTEQRPVQLLDPADLDFVHALRAAGLLDEFEGEELRRVATSVGKSSSGLARKIDLLECYYGAGGDALRARGRRLRDRFFLQRVDESVTAATVVARLSELAPEVGPIAIERIGAGNDAPLVLRAGDYFAALLDDDEESLDTDEIDLREIEERRKRGGRRMVTLRGLVRALNMLLDRHGIRERLIALRSDERREVYVATSLGHAIELARGGWLEDEEVEDVMELGAW